MLGGRLSSSSVPANMHGRTLEIRSAVGTTSRELPFALLLSNYIPQNIRYTNERLLTGSAINVKVFRFLHLFAQTTPLKRYPFYSSLNVCSCFAGGENLIKQVPCWNATEYPVLKRVFYVKKIVSVHEA